VKSERTPKPGTNWQELVRTETVIDDDASDPIPSRAVRRRLARRKKR
jgi:hypothetical protein